MADSPSPQFRPRGGTVVCGKVSSRGEGRRDSSRIGEVESREIGVDERLLGYRDRACGAIALRQHASTHLASPKPVMPYFAFTLSARAVSSFLEPITMQLSTQNTAAAKSRTV